MKELVILCHVVPALTGTYLVVNQSSRKFFCICDKVSIGQSTPQCVIGIASHTLGVLMNLGSLKGYDYYPCSLWLFMMLYTGMYTYKSFRELCLGCFLMMAFGLASVVASLISLPYVPYYSFCVYLVLIFVSLLATPVN